MEKDYRRLFATLENPAVPAGLQGLILERIDSEMRRLSRIRLAVFVPLVFLSSVAVVSSFQYLAQETAQSGFSTYLSILFSDGSNVLSFWKEFLLSLAEQAPIFGTVLFLGAILALVGSLRATLNSTQTTYRSATLAH